jgi:hypothetical protein
VGLTATHKALPYKGTGGQNGGKRTLRRCTPEAVCWTNGSQRRVSAKGRRKSTERILGQEAQEQRGWGHLTPPFLFKSSNTYLRSDLIVSATSEFRITMPEILFPKIVIQTPSS